jgi:hypothetical protein
VLDAHIVDGDVKRYTRLLQSVPQITDLYRERETRNVYRRRSRKILFESLDIERRAHEDQLEVRPPW